MIPLGILAASRQGGAAPATHWNPADCHVEVLLSSENTVAERSASANAWRSVRSVSARNSGKAYAELEILANGSANGSAMFGLADPIDLLTRFPGQTQTSWGVQANDPTGKRTYHNNFLVNRSGAAIGVGGVCFLAADFDAGYLWFGDSVSSVYAGSPADGTGPQYTFTPNKTLKIMLGMFSQPQRCRLRSLPGENLLPIPSGFSMWG